MDRLLGLTGDSEDEMRKVKSKLPFRHRNISATALQAAIVAGASIVRDAVLASPTILTREVNYLLYEGDVGLARTRVRLALYPRLAVPIFSRSKAGS